jgi:murein DD-endopeptidase MepM/ murein hydrolase activator NlpD
MLLWDSLYTFIVAHGGLGQTFRNRREWTGVPVSRLGPHRISIVRATTALLLPVLLQIAAVPSNAQETTPEPRVHVVQPGDTLFDIARRYDTTVDAIAGANDISDPTLIVVGEKLVIPSDRPEPAPPPDPPTHRRLHLVRDGETLPFLAYRYGTTIWGMREENGLNHLGVLVPGQELIIPPPTVLAASTPRLPKISSSPAAVVQGKTMLIQVEGDRALELRGSFLGQDLLFQERKGGYWALVGVGAMLTPGVYPLELEGIEAETGDVLTMSETFTVTAGSFPRYNIVVPPSREELLEPVLVETERERVDKVFSGVTSEKQWEGAFDLPLTGEFRNNAPFGQRRSYNGGPFSSYHTGHDFGADRGEPVVAPSAGTVVMAEPLKVRGKVVILDHGLGVFSGFWHLSQLDVTVGQLVSRGDVVGLVGNTGRSTGPHLHWEMRIRGVPVDPLQWTRRAFP